MKFIPAIIGAAVLLPCFSENAEAGRRYAGCYNPCYNPCYSTGYTVGYYTPSYYGGYGYGYGYPGYYGRPFLGGAIVGGALTAAAYRHHGYYRPWRGGYGYHRGFYRPHPVARAGIHRARWHR